MAKDPAFLFYTNDFERGVQFFTDEQIGIYLRLLMAQHQHGHLTEKQMIHICKSYDNDIFSKFTKDSDGKYFQERLEIEIIKRKGYTDSRSRNKAGKLKKDKILNNISKSYDSHMENENEIENKNEIEDLETRKMKFYNSVGLTFSNQYPESLLKEFCDYWTEHNANGKRMRHEMEKVFDINKRLITWNKNNLKFKNNGKHKPTIAEMRNDYKDGIIDAVKQFQERGY